MNNRKLHPNVPPEERVALPPATHCIEQCIEQRTEQRIAYSTNHKPSVTVLPSHV